MYNVGLSVVQLLPECDWNDTKQYNVRILNYECSSRIFAQCWSGYGW